MEILSLEREEQLEGISATASPQIIFKHNTTCPISKRVLRHLKEEEDVLPQNIPFYILDLLSYRDLSNTVAERFHVPHKSPQLLLIKNGKCEYNQSLYGISAEETAEALREGE